MSQKRTSGLAALVFGLALLIHSVSPPSLRAQQAIPTFSAQEGLDRMGIVGYADHMTAQPGDTVKFMVSSNAPRFHADIVRMIHGDANPKGPGVKETVIDTASNADYPGKHQSLPLGSYVTGRRQPGAAPDRQLHADGLDRAYAARSPGAWRRRARGDRAFSPNGRPAIRAASVCSSRAMAGWQSGWRPRGQAESPRPDGASPMGAVDSRHGHQPSPAARHDLVVLRGRELRRRSRPGDADSEPLTEFPFDPTRRSPSARRP